MIAMKEVHRRVELFENKIDMPTVGWNSHIEGIVDVRRWGTEVKTHEALYILSKPINLAFEVAINGNQTTGQ
jgi:hypothetical protein